MPKLGINIDHIASIRQLRHAIDPKPIVAAKICKLAGADSIVVHLREDRRHIQDQDLFALKKTAGLKLNLEMSTVRDIVDIACKVKPNQVTLVPEKRLELTTEGGLNVIKYKSKIKNTVNKLQKNNIKVSLFIDPDNKQILASKEVGVKIIELHTGKYANTKNIRQRQARLMREKTELKELIKAANFAKEIGLTVNAGHGLDYQNVKPIAKIESIEELNIGYSIICRAVIVGLKQAAKEMVDLIKI